MSQAQLSHFDRLVKNTTTPIHMISGKDNEGRDTYYYIICSSQKLDALRKVKTGMLNLSDYGKIIASGWGTEASPEVKAELLAKYGLNADDIR